MTNNKISSMYVRPLMQAVLYEAETATRVNEAATLQAFELPNRWAIQVRTPQHGVFRLNDSYGRVSRNVKSGLVASHHSRVRHGNHVLIQSYDFRPLFGWQSRRYYGSRPILHHSLSPSPSATFKIMAAISDNSIYETPGWHIPKS